MFSAKLLSGSRQNCLRSMWATVTTETFAKKNPFCFRTYLCLATLAWVDMPARAGIQMLHTSSASGKSASETDTWQPYWSEEVDPPLFQQAEKLDDITFAQPVPVLETPEKPQLQQQSLVERETRAGNFVHKPVPKKKYPGSSILADLERNEKIAVTASAEYPLQIVSTLGADSFKTVARRAAWLVKNNNDVSPKNVIILSNTPQTAADLAASVATILHADGYYPGKKREPLGPQQLEPLFGTFHYICLLYLNKFGDRIGLSSNFTVLGDYEQLKLVRRLLAHPDVIDLAERHSYTVTKWSTFNMQTKAYDDLQQFTCTRFPDAVLNESTICDAINSIKSGGSTIAKWLQTPQAKQQHLLARILKEYEAKVKHIGQLDLNDLMFHAIDLFRSYPEVVSDIKHVFVDAFDTTTNLQYQVLESLVQSKKNFTVVTDSSIESNDLESLLRLRKEHPDYQRVILPQKATKSSVKGLSPPSVPTIVSSSASPEAIKTITADIKKLACQPDAVFKYSDFAIFLEPSQALEFLSVVKAAFHAEGMPFEVADESSFWKKREILALLSTFRTVQSNYYEDATEESASSLNWTIPPNVASRLKKTRVAPTFFEKLEASENGYIHEWLFSTASNVKQKRAKFVGLIQKSRAILASLSTAQSTTSEETLEKKQLPPSTVLGVFFDRVIAAYDAGAWRTSSTQARNREIVASMRHRLLATVDADPAVMACTEWRGGTPDYLATFLRLHAIGYAPQGPESSSQAASDVESGGTVLVSTDGATGSKRLFGFRLHDAKSEAKKTAISQVA